MKGIFTSFYVALFFLPLLLTAQSAAKADKAFSYQQYYKAIALYKKSFAAGDSIASARKLGECYQALGDMPNAETWFGKIADKAGVDPSVKLNYAEALRSNRKFTEAGKYYEAYQKSLSKPDARVEEIQKSMDKIRVLDRNQPAYSVEIAAVNTSRSEKSPVLMNGGKILLSSNKLKNNTAKNKDKRKNYQLFETMADSATLLSPAEIGATKKYNYSNATYSAKTNELVFSSSRFYKCAKKAIKNQSNEQLYSVNYPGTAPIKLSISTDEASYTNPALSADGKTLYFSSNKAGGAGGWDIYVSKKDANGAWSQPVNAGRQINSTYNETYPFISSDGTLYFSSDAPAGLGGWDIYKAKEGDGEWEAPVNLGRSVNSGSNDFGLVLDSTNLKGYLVSNRQGGLGSDDIYNLRIDPTKLDFEITLKVLDVDVRMPLEGAAVVMRCNNMAIDEKRTDQNGMVLLSVRGGQKCNAQISKGGYTTGTVQLLYNDRNRPVDVSLSRSEVKLVVSVTETENGKPVHDAAVTLTAASNGGSRNYVTDLKGKFECRLDPTEQYTISSPDYTTIADNLVPAKSEITDGTIKREYKVNQADVKINVPLTADCFEPNSIVNITDPVTKTVIKAQADDKGHIRLDLMSNSVYVFEQNGVSNEVKTIGLLPGDEVSNACKFYVGQTWIIDNIFYNYNEAKIRPDAAKDLDRLAKIMKAHPGLEIEIGSHTDCRGSIAYNTALSATRAKSAVEYIVGKDISKRRIIAAGYGELKLLNNCKCEPTNESPCSDEEHSVNRRTEVKVLKY